MKKELIQMLTTSTAPAVLAVLSMLSMSAAQATEQSLAEQHAELGISAEPDEDGYYVIYRPVCGKTLGTVSSEGLKYKLGRSVTCPDPVVNNQPAFTVIGHNTEFNLNGKTIDCANDIESGVKVGVAVSGDHGKLLGSDDGKRKGKIINCPIGVIIGSSTLNLETTGHNLIKNVHVEDCFGPTSYGFAIASNYNRLENNIADCRQVGELQMVGAIPSAGFILGVTRTSMPTIPFFHGNVLEGNYATNNINGYLDHNIGQDFYLKADNENKSELANLFIDNGADFNVDNGFYVIGAGGEYLYNHANQNGGNGFVYSYNNQLNNSPRGEVLIAKFEGNDAFKNNEDGFAALEFMIGSVNHDANGAFFKDNVALFNNQADEGDHDLYDSHHTCASDDAGMEFHNRWIHNLAFTAHPNCTRGGRLVASSVE
jgi:hypothetical protein